MYVDVRGRDGVPTATASSWEPSLTTFFHDFLQKRDPPFKIVIFATFPLRGYEREKRGRATESVLPLRDLPCLSYDCYFISRFFLVDRDPYGKIEKSLYGPVKCPINRIFIHLDTKPRRREQYMHSSQWS